MSGTLEEEPEDLELDYDESLDEDFNPEPIETEES
jgi:hypothetical protein